MESRMPRFHESEGSRRKIRLRMTVTPPMSGGRGAYSCPEFLPLEKWWKQRVELCAEPRKKLS